MIYPKMVLFAFMVAGSLSSKITFGQSKAKSGSPARPINFPALTSKEFTSSLPVRGITIDNRNGLWIHTPKQLWRLNLLTKKLTNLNLQLDKAESYQAVVFLNNEIFAATNAAIYRLDVKTGKTKRYSGKGDRPTQAKLFIFENLVVWQSAGFASYLPVDDEGLIHIPNPIAKGTDLERQLFNPLMNQWWLAQKNLLLRLDNKGKELDGLSSIDEFIQLNYSKNRILAFTATKIFVLTLDGNKEKEIEIIPPTKIACSHINDDQHTYIFDTGLIESYGLSNQQKKIHQLAKPADFSSCVRRKQILATIAAGDIQIYQLFDSSE